MASVSPTPRSASLDPMVLYWDGKRSQLRIESVGSSYHRSWREMVSWTVNIQLKLLQSIRRVTRPGTLQIPFIYDNLAPLVTLGSEEESPSHSIKIPFTTHNRFHRLSRRLMMLAVLVSICKRTLVSFSAREVLVEDSTHFQGRVVLAKDRGQLTYVLETPLTSRDGSQDGRYVTQRSSYRYPWQYEDLQLPFCLRYTTSGTRFYGTRLPMRPSQNYRKLRSYLMKQPVV